MIGESAVGHSPTVSLIAGWKLPSPVPSKSERQTLGGRPLHDQSSSTPRREIDAAPAPEDRVYTVISGAFYIGLGDEFDPKKLQAYPPGSVVVLSGNTSHFRWAKSSEYVTQVTAIGPLGLEYVSASDDPRSHVS